MKTVTNIVLVFVRIRLLLAQTNQYFLDVNDILDENLMPASFLMLEGISGEHNEVLSMSGRSEDYDLSSDNVTAQLEAATMDRAFSTMGFHRRKINEFLCSNFVAAQIMADVMPTPAIGGEKEKLKKITRRVGTVDEMDMNDVTLQPKDLMLYDQGSSNYKNWLSKTTTLEDIYKNYAMNNLGNTSMHNDDIGVKFSRKKDKNIMRAHQQQADYDDEYEEGILTGYAVHEPANNNEQAPKIMNDAPAIHHQHFPVDHSIDLMYNGPIAGSKTAPKNIIYDNRFMIDYINQLQNGLTPLHNTNNLSSTNEPSNDPNNLNLQIGEGYGDYDLPQPAYGVPPSGMMSGLSKSLGLKDLFDIALTTLAFLSFGMFILQVIMCITMSKTDNNMLMMPMEIDGEIDVDGGVEGELEVRQKREITSNKNVVAINEISRRVLKSIDAVIQSNKDQAKCLQRTVCENNLFSRNQESNQKYWIPVWGLGLSWLSSRIITFQAPSNSILDGLKASVIGLGGGNCTKFYGNCDDAFVHMKKRKKK